MTEQLYPRPESDSKARRQARKERRRYRVYYVDMVTEGGHASWIGYHHTYVGARIAAWWNTHVATYGHGTAILNDTLG